MAATSYAEYADVAARAGRWAQTFQVADAHPNQADVEQLLEDCPAPIDAALLAKGFAPASVASEAKAALKDVAAYGALGRALAGIPDPPDDLAKLRDWAVAVWGAAMGNPKGADKDARAGSIATGVFPGVAMLESASGGPTAGSFFTDEPQYGSEGSVESEAARWTADTAEVFAKGQSL